MRILIIRPGRFPPDLYAGAELTLLWLARELIAHGHQVAASAATTARDDAAIAVDRICGFPVFRASNYLAAAQAAAVQFPADVFVISEAGPWAARLPQIVRDGPIVAYEQDVSTGPREMPEALKSRISFVANSPASAANLAGVCGLDSVTVPPLFGVTQYAGIQRRGNAVLFVSLQPRKGADVAIRIAQARPQVPFIFVESWTRDPAATDELRAIVRGVPNIKLLPNQPDLSKVWPLIRLLLMPSRSQEAWGRTATEAQICGIPVLGSSRGNLRDTIGPGGVTLDPDEPIERWLAAFDRIMDHRDGYDALAAKALEHGRLAATQAERAYHVFERVLRDAIARKSA